MKVASLTLCLAFALSACAVKYGSPERTSLPEIDEQVEQANAGRLAVELAAARARCGPLEVERKWGAEGNSPGDFYCETSRDSAANRLDTRNDPFDPRNSEFRLPDKRSED
jgi:hypothetical protein